MMVGKCPEEPLEGDMSSPNSTGTQVREGQGFPTGETKLVTQMALRIVSLALGSPAGDSGWT